MSGRQAPPRLISKPSSTTNTKSNRLPAPTLFVGPPSLNASQISINRNLTPDFVVTSPTHDRSTNPRDSNSLHPTNTNTTAGSTSTTLNNANNSLRPTRTPLERTRSGLSYRTAYTAANEPNPSSSSTAAGPNNTNNVSHDLQVEQPLAVPGLRKPSDRSLDAKWRDMQLALNEVELTAQSTTQVFDARHARALDELRRAQIDLAHAWGRGNERTMSQLDANQKENEEGGGAQGEEVARRDFGAKLSKDKNGAATAVQSRARAPTNASASTALSDESLLSDDSAETEAGRNSGGARVEDETAQDIRMAAERRAANEAYFRGVDAGVKDVVAKLQAVAAAMKGVEAESRSLWSRSESELTSSTEDGADRRVEIPTARV